MCKMAVFSYQGGSGEATYVIRMNNRAESVTIRYLHVRLFPKVLSGSQQEIIYRNLINIIRYWQRRGEEWRDMGTLGRG